MATRPMITKPGRPQGVKQILQNSGTLATLNSLAGQGVRPYDALKQQQQAIFNQSGDGGQAYNAWAANRQTPRIPKSPQGQAGQLERVSPGVYRDAQGNLVKGNRPQMQAQQRPMMPAFKGQGSVTRPQFSQMPADNSPAMQNLQGRPKMTGQQPAPIGMTPMSQAPSSQGMLNSNPDLSNATPSKAWNPFNDQALAAYLQSLNNGMNYR